MGVWLVLFKKIQFKPHTEHCPFLDFKLSPCSEWSMLSFVQFPGVWILYANVSEHSVCSIFVGGLRPMKMEESVWICYADVSEHCLFHLHRQVGINLEQTECSETLAYKIQTPENYPEGSIQHSPFRLGLRGLGGGLECWKRRRDWTHRAKYDNRKENFLTPVIVYKVLQ